jgi:hypothetical protein
MIATRKEKENIATPSLRNTVENNCILAYDSYFLILSINLGKKLHEGMGGNEPGMFLLVKGG